MCNFSIKIFLGCRTMFVWPMGDIIFAILFSDTGGGEITHLLNLNVYVDSSI